MDVEPEGLSVLVEWKVWMWLMRRPCARPNPFFWIRQLERPALLLKNNNGGRGVCRRLNDSSRDVVVVHAENCGSSGMMQEGESGPMECLVLVKYWDQVGGFVRKKKKSESLTLESHSGKAINRRSTEQTVVAWRDAKVPAWYRLKRGHDPGSWKFDTALSL